MHNITNLTQNFITQTKVVLSATQKDISKELIEGPTNDKQRAYSIWIYVKDHYHNFDESNKLKHIFTHGSMNDSN